jgi:hypothetical protein
MASKPKEKPKTTELPLKASVTYLRATRKKSTQETDMPDPDTSDWKMVKQTVKHHHAREGTLKKDVKRIMPLINAIITKGKKSDGKKIEQWITVKFRKVETTLKDNPQLKVKETCNQLKTVAKLIGHGGLF